MEWIVIQYEWQQIYVNLKQLLASYKEVLQINIGNCDTAQPVHLPATTKYPMNAIFILLVIINACKSAIIQLTNPQHQHTTHQNANNHSVANHVQINDNQPIPPNTDQHQHKYANAQSQIQKQWLVSSYQYIGDVILYHQFPSHFVVGQAFTVQGQVAQSKLKSYLQNLKIIRKTYLLCFALVEKLTHQQFVITKQMPINQTKFTQQIYFSKPIDFYFGIFIGDNAMIPPKIYKVNSKQDSIKLSQSLQPTTAPKIRPIGLRFEADMNDMYIRWIPQTKLTRLRIYQQKQGQIIHQNQFVVSNDMGYLKIPYLELSGFEQMETTIQISHAHSSNLGLSQKNSSYCRPLNKVINMTKHHFMQYRTDLISLNSDLNTLMSLGDELVIEGVTQQQLMDYAIILQPNGSITEVPLAASIKSNGTIASLSGFYLSFILQQEGTFIVQINHKLGYAVLNMPVYVGSAYPAIPDQIQPLSSQPNKPIQLNHGQAQTQQNLILQLINKVRADHGSESVSIDLNLSKVAQSHCQDMIARNYVSHLSPQHENSKARAAKFGIYQKIGENIATDKDLSALQYKLNRSPLHLRNTISKEWTKVGIAILKNVEQEFYVVQLFSTNKLPNLSEQELSSIKQDIISGYNGYTKQQIEQNKQLSAQLQKWQQNYSIQNIGNLKSILSSFSLKSIVFLSANLQLRSNYFQSLVKNNYIKAYGKKNIGVVLKQEKGLLKLTAILY